MIKKYKLGGTEQAGRCKEQYRKWKRQRSYMHDPWMGTKGEAGIAGGNEGCWVERSKREKLEQLS